MADDCTPVRLTDRYQRPWVSARAAEVLCGRRDEWIAQFPDCFNLSGEQVEHRRQRSVTRRAGGPTWPLCPRA